MPQSQITLIIQTLILIVLTLLFASLFKSLIANFFEEQPRLLSFNLLIMIWLQSVMNLSFNASDSNKDFLEWMSLWKVSELCTYHAQNAERGAGVAIKRWWWRILEEEAAAGATTPSLHSALPTMQPVQDASASCMNLVTWHNLVYLFCWVAVKCQILQRGDLTVRAGR